MTTISNDKKQNIVNPSLEELKKGKYNAYTLVIATSKCAREINDEYQTLKDAPVQASHSDLETKIKQDLKDEKAVQYAVKLFRDGEYEIDDETVEKNV